MTNDFTPWWEVVELRDEIAAAGGEMSDVQMSLYETVYGDGEVPYADADYYGEITHPSPGLIDLMSAVAVRMGSSTAHETARGAWRLDQAMGGGKSHGLIGLWHLARNPRALRGTDIGRAVWARAEKIAGQDDLADDLNTPHVVVLSCDNITPGEPDQDVDGPAATLGERFLWRLFEATDKQYETYQQYRKHTANKEKLREALTVLDRPVLILIDEILDYLRKATQGGENEVAVDDMAFLSALLEVVTKTDNCVLVMVMIASERDVVTMGEFGERCRDELEGKTTRNARTTTVTSGGDFADILRRRLFKQPPPTNVITATVDAFKHGMGGQWAADVFGRLTWSQRTSEFTEEVERTYPFHPSLMLLAEKEWSRHAGFQKVRSTIQIFAATVHALAQRAAAGDWAPALIGVGDVPLSNRYAREAVLGSGVIEDQRTVASYREIAINDVVGDDDEGGNARQLDLKRDPSMFQQADPRIAERMATAMFLYSLAPRAQGNAGATESELLAAGFTPDPAVNLAEVQAVLEELKSADHGLAALDEIPGKGGQERRYQLSTRMTLRMFYRAQRDAVDDAARDELIASLAGQLTNTGPFDAVKYVSAEDHDLEKSGKELLGELLDILSTSGIDDAHSNRLVVLDPRAFTLLNGQDGETKDAIRAAFGLGEHKLPVAWASSCVFAVVNTQRRGRARRYAAEYLAWKRVGQIDAVREDEDLKEQATQEARDARRQLDTAIKAAYQHVAYLGEDVDSGGHRTPSIRRIRFDKDGHTALDGTIVWAALADADKAFKQGEFNGKALLHNMRPEDWGRPLSEIRDAFYNAPRLPLLPGGDGDLKNAIFDAYSDGEVVLTKDGERRKAERPGDINLLAGLRLEKPDGAKTVKVPNFLGMPVVAAEEAARGYGISLTVSGPATGQVKSQRPAAGELIEVGESIAVEVEDGEDLPPTDETQVTISITGLSLHDQPSRDRARLLFDALGEVAEDVATHLMLTTKIVVPKERSGELVQRADDLGATVRKDDV